MPFPSDLLVFCLYWKLTFFTFTKNYVNAFLYVYAYICSARLAAATGAGDHAGLKEEGKKDFITGRTLSHQNIKFILSFESVGITLI